MPYTESEITRDFDRLSLLSEGTPIEKISGYSLTYSPKKESAYVTPNPNRESAFVTVRPNAAQAIVPNNGQLQIHDDAYDDESFSSSTSSNTSSNCSPKLLGKGRGKIIVPQRENTLVRCELDHELEKEMRLANPQGYSNELIEHHFAHHLKENQPQAIALPAENMVPIPANNVALLSLTRNAKKRIKQNLNNGLVLNDKNFPKLK